MNKQDQRAVRLQASLIRGQIEYLTNAAKHSPLEMETKMTVRERLNAIRSNAGFQTNYGDVLATDYDAKERTVSVWINGKEAILIPEEVHLLQVALREELDFATGNRS